MAAKGTVRPFLFDDQAIPAFQSTFKCQNLSDLPSLAISYPSRSKKSFFWPAPKALKRVNKRNVGLPLLVVGMVREERLFLREKMSSKKCFQR